LAEASGITLTRRIKVSNSTTTPIIENEKILSKEELARILKAALPKIKVTKSQTLGSDSL